jgi:hypothetical protein
MAAQQAGMRAAQAGAYFHGRNHGRVGTPAPVLRAHVGRAVLGVGKLFVFIVFVAGAVLNLLAWQASR